MLVGHLKLMSLIPVVLPAVTLMVHSVVVWSQMLEAVVFAVKTPLVQLNCLLVPLAGLPELV